MNRSLNYHRILSHAACVLVFAVQAVVWTYPLARDLSSQILGDGAGDNVSFLWNFWWMRVALANDISFFHTGHLLAPAGVDLTLHTHTALPALVGATVFQRLDVATALNMTVLLAVFLSATATYALAWRMTRSHHGALMAGFIYGGSPFMTAHLHGHFNLIHAWAIPLFAYPLLTAIDHRRLRSSALAGAILGMTAYVDYYLLVYQLILLVVLMLAKQIGVTVTRTLPTPGSRWLFRASVTIGTLMLALIVTIAVTGGFALQIAGVRISARGLFNPLQLFWICVIVSTVAWLRPRLSITGRADIDRRWSLRHCGVMGLIAGAIMAPLIQRGVSLIQRGEYVSQQYLWRSAPKGVDASTLFVGNPFGVLGPWLARIHDAASVDPIEGSAWLGIVPVALAMMAVRQYGTNEDVRRWLWVAGVFFLWALGSHLIVFGANTGLILPQVVARYVPIVSNARIPGRAILVTYLAISVLAALAMTRAHCSSARKLVLTTVLFSAVLADFVPTPFPTMKLDRPKIYEVLRNRPEPGALLELPLGIRDGFGEHGRLDHRVLFFQTIHGRPLVGGFVARSSPAVRDLYLQDQLLRSLLYLSGDETLAVSSLPDAASSGALLRKHGVKFVMLNRATAPSELVRYVESTLPLVRVIDEGAAHVLYMVQ